ncbi:MAG TPA: helix-turn-helix transcriptional regulator [Actinophytocola sp.]|jgi:DNA-binding CsgD family transcriptional regulator|uniref:helix-turn-helix transcriptional regulator n=1 Tax=Actinophytocola sp. TaxID=1872138 RepID=UPI002F948215
MTVSYYSGDAGLAESTERVYRTIVEGVRDPDTLADRLGVDVTAALAELTELGLVQVEAGVLEPLPPRLPLQALADRYVRAAAAAREASEVLAQLWARQSSAPDYLEVLTTTPRVMEETTRLHEESEKEVLALSIGPRGDSAPPPNRQPGAAEALRRGVAYRVVYGAQILRQVEVMALVQESVDAGESARVFPNVPCNLQIADGKRAVLTAPMPGPERLHGLMFFEGGFLESLIGVFETYWTLGVPIAADHVGDAGPAGPNEDTRRLLSMLGAGLTDASIARELGVSERTVTRRIMALQDALAARSRFQLGVQAARRGWL